MFAWIANLLGITICALVALQMILFVLRSWLGLLNDARANRLRIERLNSEIDSLRQKHAVTEVSTAGWEGFRKFRVDRLVPECDAVRSIYLVPHDGKTLPAFEPGQYLTFQLKIPDQSKAVVRCYSLSDGPGRPYYRCSIKQIPAPPDRPDLPPGVASTYMNQIVREGDILDVKSPRGSFFLDVEDNKSVVLLAGGIGITPLASMLHALCRSSSDRKAVLFYGVCHSRDHALAQELKSLCENNQHVQQVVCYSEPLATDVVGRDYDVAGWVTPELLRDVLGTNDHEFYLCGPPPFMNDLVDGLEAWGVPQESIHTEAFGPASVKKPKPEPLAKQSQEQPWVGFDRSKKIVRWNPSYTSLLDFAAAQGIELESGCRAGNCGTCTIAIKSGQVTYTDDPSSEVEKGTCLPCVCVPDGALALDA